MTLETIKCPADVKKLEPSQLDELAKEIRQTIIDVVSEKGGHFATPLGAVDLTIALHRVFDSPKDKIIWDVGHQIYAHKLLTGRRDNFHTLRQYGGISGFPCRDESPHDHFATGHASTSVSAALGMAMARDINGGDYKVVAVIGDGGLTGGVAYEGMDHAGHMNKDMIVILNDNDMSISPPVGAISHYLNRVITSFVYNRTKKEVDKVLEKSIGNALMRRLQKVEESIKSLIVPGVFFEELGFRYFGPINGHDIKELEETLRNLKDLKGPSLLHIITEKGHGYELAVDDPTKWHGAKPFDKVTGEPKPKKTAKASPPAYTNVFGETVCKIVEKHPNVVGITAAMASGTGLNLLAKQSPKNFIDVGIAEQHAVLLAAGLACEGVRPIVAIYSTFLQRAYDQIFHDVCAQNLPVIFALDRAGVVGDDGKQFQGLYDIAFLRALPNIVVSAPGNERDLSRLLWTALQHNGPFAIRYPRDVAEGLDWSVEDLPLPIGKGEVLEEGADVAILGYGHMVHRALEAAGLLRQQGINPTVVNMRFAKPLDAELIRELSEKHHHFVAYEDHSIFGGFSSAVAEAMFDMGMEGYPLLRLALPDQVIPHGARKQIFEEHRLMPAQVATRILEFVNSKAQALAV